MMSGGRIAADLDAAHLAVAALIIHHPDDAKPPDNGAIASPTHGRAPA
jgi:hypothetical protein